MQSAITILATGARHKREVRRLLARASVAPVEYWREVDTLANYSIEMPVTHEARAREIVDALRANILPNSKAIIVVRESSASVNPKGWGTQARVYENVGSGDIFRARTIIKRERVRVLKPYLARARASELDAGVRKSNLALRELPQGDALKAHTLAQARARAFARKYALPLTPEMLAFVARAMTFKAIRRVNADCEYERLTELERVAFARAWKRVRKADAKANGYHIVSSWDYVGRD